MTAVRSRRIALLAAILLSQGLALVAAGQPGDAASNAGEVSIYSHRHYQSDDLLYDRFRELTGIRVNVVQGNLDELIARLQREGSASPADLLFTVDAGRLVRAKELGLLQPVASAPLRGAVPGHLRDPDGYWYGLTRRARVIVYHRDRVDPSELSTYEALTEARWRGRVLIRSSSNIYNQSLLASIIASDGATAARNWAAGMVANMARTPSGGDTDQIKAVAAGEGDVAVVNTYYFGRLQASDEAADRQVVESIGVFFPNQQRRGTHVNVSGGGVTATAKNLQNAIALLEFLVSVEAQGVYAGANHEYPVNPEVDAESVLAGWGSFRADDLGLHQLGERNAAAVRIFDEVDWR